MRPTRFLASMLFAVVALLSVAPATTVFADSTSPRILVLPLRVLGVSDTTALVSGALLAGSLGDLGMNVVSADPSLPPLPSGKDACDAAACASDLAKSRGAELVAYGSLDRLGGKIIARITVLRTDEAAPYYRDQLTASSEDDLDHVMRRFAEGIAAGRPNSNRATVESVTQAETITPARRATRSGAGFRAGFLFPTGNSFGGVDRMTNLHATFRYEFRDFQVETTPVVGFTWGKGNFDWTLLDIGAARIFGTSDFSTYLGASVGVHTVTVERPFVYANGGFYASGGSQTETVPTADLVAGLLALRTYDFVALVELRYHYVFERFDRAGGGGAQGFMLTIGTSR